MYFSDLGTSMATLKAGGATTVTQTTKLMLPHEMLSANGSTQLATSSLTSGHSTTALLIPNSHHFYHQNTFQNSTVYNNSNDINHTFRTTANNATTSNSLLHNNLLGNQQNTSSATINMQQHANSISNSSYNHQSHVNHYSDNTASSEKNAATSSTQQVVTVLEQMPVSTSEAQSNESDKNQVASTGSTTEQEVEEEPEIDIVINNVVCSFSVRCHLNLRNIALNGFNVEFRRENGMVTMKLRRPYTTASIWSSGRITCTGATSEDQVSL